MPGKNILFIGRKNELAQFKHILSQRGLSISSRVILIHGDDGIGKTSLAKTCLDMAKKARWYTVAIDWAQNTPHTPLRLLNIISDAVWNVIGEQQVHFLEEFRARIDAVQATIDQYQQDHPEIWQAMVSQAVNEAEQNSVSPAALDPKNSARQLLISYMQNENLFPKRLDETVLREPNRKLAQALSESMVKGTGRRGLVIWFDGCDSLPPEMELFLRETVVGPTMVKNAKLHFILSGKANLYREHIVTDLIGKQHSIKGYGDQFYRPPPIVWDLPRMVDPEVNEFLENRDLGQDGISVARIQQLSQGLPFVLELISDVIHQKGVEYAYSIFNNNQSIEVNADILQGIVQQFTEKYQEPTELQMLFTLALLLSPQDSAISAVCNLTADETPGPIRTKISEAYTFVNHDGSLHDIMRAYLRRYLRANNQEYAQFLGHNAAIYYQTPVKNYASQNTQERVNNHHWHTIQANLLNALCWTDEKRAMKLLASSILEAAIYNREFAFRLLALTSEFRNTPAYWSDETCQMWDTFAQMLSDDIGVRQNAFDKLDEIKTELSLSDVHLTIFNILAARLLMQKGQSESAVKFCDAVFNPDLQDSSVKQSLASTYFEVGISLGFHKEQAIASEDALHAFKQAKALESQSAPIFYGLGSILAAFNLLEEAIDAYSKALSLNPQHTNTTFQRGMAHYKLKQYSSALVDLNQTLNLNSRHALGSYYRGLTHFHLGDQPKALSDYSKAISLNPNMVQAYVKRGISYSAIGQLEKALNDFEQALQQDPEIIEVYTARGEVYVKLNQHENALKDFSHVLTLNADLAAVYAQRGYTHASLYQYKDAIKDYDQALELDPTQSTVHIQRGDVYMALTMYEDALDDYSATLVHDPNNAVAYRKRGAVLKQLGKLDDAVSDFAHALDIDPQQPLTHTEYAEVHLILGQYEETLQDYAAALTLDPTLTGFESKRGLAYLHLKEYEKALVDFRTAFLRNSEDATILYNLGVACYHLGRYEEALNNFIDALKINPQYAEVYIYRAKTQVLLGKLDQALLDFGQAIAVDQKNPDAYYSRGSIYVDLNRYDEAVEDFDQAIALDPTMSEAYNKRGLAYTNIHKIDYALEDFAQSIRLNPQSASVYINRGNTYAKIEEFEKALLDYTQAITRNPQLTEAYYNRGNILMDMGQLDNAIADFTQAIAFNPNIEQAYYNRGNTYAQLGQLDKALSDMDKVIQLHPQDTAALNNRGNIYADLGKPEQALADYEQALTINPNLSEVYTNRGLTYADLGQYDEALNDYAKALSINSNDATAIYYSACVFGLLEDESQACAWLKQAILMDSSFREIAGNDSDFDNIRQTKCFQFLTGITQD